MAQAFPVRTFMDEVDGRPGHVALQSGHADAPNDVLKISLSLPEPTPQRTVILSERSESGVPSKRFSLLGVGVEEPAFLLSPINSTSAPFFWRGPAEGRLPHRRWRRTP